MILICGGTVSSSGAGAEAPLSPRARPSRIVAHSGGQGHRRFTSAAAAEIASNSAGQFWLVLGVASNVENYRVHGKICGHYVNEATGNHRSRPGGSDPDQTGTGPQN